MNAAAPCCLAETLLLSAGINFTIALLSDERRMAHGIWGSRLLLQVFKRAYNTLSYVGENKRNVSNIYLLMKCHMKYYQVILNVYCACSFDVIISMFRVVLHAEII